MQVVIFFSCLSMVVQFSEQRVAGRQMYIDNRPYNLGAAQNFDPPQQQSLVSLQNANNYISQTQTESIAVIQRRWSKTQSFCNSVTGRVAKFISKIEEMVLGLPLAIIKTALGIPSDVVKVAISLAQSLLPKLEKAKQLLEVFFQTVFDLPAKAMYGSISIFLDLVNKMLDWGQACDMKPVCGNPFPAIGGYGPCGGRWPCTTVMACQSNTCLQTARALEVDFTSELASVQEKPEKVFQSSKA
uniref:Cytochrome P450-terp n=1 Tax=Lygus hesperus TaxID=30085 RepID=A0A0A9Z4L3_LYGHE